MSQTLKLKKIIEHGKISQQMTSKMSFFKIRIIYIFSFLMYILISLENNESIKLFPTTDLKSPDILQNETTRERTENNLEDFFNTADSVSKLKIARVKKYPLKLL